MSIFDNIDILDIIVNFLPYESKLIIHRVSKIFIIYEERCKTCKYKMCLPVVFKGKLNCYKCTDLLLSKSDVQFWKSFDSLSRDHKNRSYLKCSNCNIKCKSSEWYHYHITFKCELKNKL